MEQVGLEQGVQRVITFTSGRMNGGRGRGAGEVKKSKDMRLGTGLPLKSITLELSSVGRGTPVRHETVLSPCGHF